MCLKGTEKRQLQIIIPIKKKYSVGLKKETPWLTNNFRKEIYQLPYLEMDHIVDDIARVAADADGQIRYDNFVKLMQNWIRSNLHSYPLKKLSI